MSNTTNNIPTKRHTYSWKIDLIGVGLMVVLGLCVWQALTPPVGFQSIVSLALIGYAAFYVVYELTWNRHKVPTLATGHQARRKIAALLKREQARMGKTPFEIVDLGSGRGQLTRFLARRLGSDAHVTGIEIASLPHEQALLMKKVFGPANADFKCLDFGTFDCAQADAFYMYLSGGLTREVGEKLYAEMRPGCVVITHTFPLEGHWVPAEIVEFRTPFRERLYFYRR